MIKVFARCSWLSLLGLVLAVFFAGCGDANEADFKKDGPTGKGTADPKYASDTPATYEQYSRDLGSQANKKAAPASGKAAAAAGKATVPEPEKKP